MSAPAVLDVEHIIDRNGVGRLQRRVLLICFGVLIVDGIDTTMSGYLGPALIADWGISKADLGPVVTSGLVGLALGSLIAGPLADRFGRQRIILLSLIFFGLLSAASALTSGVASFSALRVLTGLGLGASMPNAATLVAEYAPRARRGVMMTFMYCGFTLGAAVGGYLTSFLIASASWRLALVAGGVLPIAFAGVVFLALPESPKFLARRGGRAGELTALLNQIEPGCVGDGGSAARFTLTEDQTGGGAPVRALLSPRYRIGTATIWAGFLAAFFTVYLMNSWLPILMSDVGFSLIQVATIGFLLQFGGTIGNIAIGFVMDRAGMHRTIIVSTICAGAMLVAIAAAPRSVLAIGALIFVLGIFTNSLAVAFPVLAAAFYPTAMRATGTSWATGIARIGAIGGAAAGTVLVALGLDYKAVFLTLLVPVAVGVLAASINSRVRH
jgi:AAHS family 4-hydroxybenzoate transporter-like MFS transporter